MNLYLLLSLIAGNLFLCTVILFNLFYSQKLSQQSLTGKVKVQIESKKLEKPEKLNRLKNIPEKSNELIIVNKDKDKTIISKPKSKVKPRELKIKTEKTNQINEADLKAEINQPINNTAQTASVKPKEEIINPNPNTESTKAIEDLTNQYYKSLSLSKKETKALLNTLLKPNRRHPCLAWQINGETLENCQSDNTILEAGIYAINAKLIPCKKQITYKNYKTYIACYKNRKI